MAWSRSVFLTLAVLVVSDLILRIFLFEVLWVQTDRFEPALKRGDVLGGVKFMEPRLGDVVSHSCVRLSHCLSQILGKEGDRVDLREGQFFVNEREVPMLFLAPSDAALPESGAWVVPPGAYFVYGDALGVVSATELSSVFSRILLSFDSVHSGVRWSRFGLRIR